MKTEESMLAEMCRYVDASINKGFDGKEHPKHTQLVKSVLGVLYPYELSDLVDLINGKTYIEKTPMSLLLKKQT